VLYDAVALHQLLRAGYSRWGQVRLLHERGGEAAIRPLMGKQAATVFATIRDVVRCVEFIQRQWRIGRGRPVDRDLIEECDSVSRVFVERLVELATACDGDASAVLAAIEAGELKGFRKAKAQELREELAERGCLPEQRRKHPDEIRVEFDAFLGNAFDERAQTRLRPFRDRVLGLFPELS
jgi:hypothetical protein